MGDRAGRLETWTLATFDLTALALVVLLAGYRSGGLSDALAGLGTTPGLLLFGYLWGLVVLAVRWVLAEGGLGEANVRTLLLRGALGGAGVGGALVAGVVLVGGAFVVDDPSALASVAVLGSVATVVGAVVGALAGTLFAVVNVLLDSAAGWAVPAVSTDRREE
jgi:hypothetical protein